MSSPREKSTNRKDPSATGLPVAGGSSLIDLPVHSIQADPGQPRSDLGDLSSLMESIALHGVVQPIIVSPIPSGGYQAVAGHRRLEACRRLEVPTIPAIVRSVEDHERLQLQIIENMQRADLNPVDEALAFRRLADEFGLSQRRIANRLGKSLTEINDTLRILKLSPDLLDSVRISEHLSRSFWTEVAKEPSPERPTPTRRQSPPPWAPRCKPSASSGSIRLERNPSRCKVGDVAVIVRAKTGPLSPAAICCALRQALKQARESS